MPANRAEWESRHRESAEKPPTEAASIVREWLPLLPEGPALDLACGTGRHSLLLAERGYAVTAVDWSAPALDVLENRARSAKIPVVRADAVASTQVRARSIHVVHADIEQVHLPGAAFAVILCIQYLQRSLFPHVVRALRPGGVLLFETFTRAQLNYSGGPRNPAHLLESGELRYAFPGLHALFYRELNAGQGIASLVAHNREVKR